MAEPPVSGQHPTDGRAWQARVPGSPVATSTASFARAPLPPRFCNLDRLLYALEMRGLDGIVATLPWKVF
jgi:hypothetical protein